MLNSKKCKQCAIKPISEFDINPKTNQPFSRCRKCRDTCCNDCGQQLSPNNKTRIYKSKCKECAQKSIARKKKYRRTAKGFWKAMNYRCSHNPNYRKIEVKMTYEEWDQWVTPRLNKFKKQYPSQSPSVDRINPNGHYELGNVRIISRLHNMLISGWILPKKLKSKQEKMKHICRVVALMCKEYEIDFSEMTIYLNQTVKQLYWHHQQGGS